MTLLRHARLWRSGHAWATNAALCVIGLLLLGLCSDFTREMDHFWLGFSGVSSYSAWLYVAAAVVVLTQPVNKATLWIVAAFAVAFHVVALPADPFLSSDIYRYVWDGIVQHAHVNPYRYVPGDAALKALRAPHQEIFDNINRRDYARTIYPPVAQMLYWLVTLVSPTVLAMKTAMVILEAVTAWALVRMLGLMRRPAAQVLLFAWCPVLVWEIGGSGHIDAAVFCFVTLALLARWRDRDGWTGVLLGVAIMMKFYPLVLVPALWRRGDWKLPAAIVSIAAVGYAVYSSAGRLVFGFLGGYAKEEGMETGARYFLLELARHVPGLAGLPTGVYVGFCAVVMGAIAWWCWKHAAIEVAAAARTTPPRFVTGALALGFAMTLLFSPHYPWYVVWLVPFLALVPNLPLLVYLMAFFYLFTTPLADGSAPKMYVLNQILYGVTAISFLLAAGLRRWPVLRYFKTTDDGAVAPAMEAK